MRRIDRCIWRRSSFRGAFYSVESNLCRFQQTIVAGHRVLNHRRVGFARDVDRCHRRLLRRTLGEPRTPTAARGQWPSRPYKYSRKVCLLCWCAELADSRLEATGLTTGSSKPLLKAQQVAGGRQDNSSQIGRFDQAAGVGLRSDIGRDSAAIGLHVLSV